MALSTLLEITKRACDELVLARPTVLVAGTDPEHYLLLACANAAGRDLMRAHHWSALQTTGTFSLVNGTATYALATDYDRMIPDTAWDRTNDRFMVGPDNPQTYFYLTESGVADSTLNKRYRIVGTNAIFWPTPSATETAVYGYISNKWARSSGGTAQTEFAADTDTTVFDPDLMKAEIKWRFAAAKSLPSMDFHKREAMDMRASRIAADVGGAKLNMSPDPAGMFVELDNIADASWSLS